MPREVGRVAAAQLPQHGGRGVGGAATGEERGEHVREQVLLQLVVEEECRTQRGAVRRVVGRW